VHKAERRKRARLLWREAGEPPGGSERIGLPTQFGVNACQRIVYLC
jgi:hypothetical protein